MPRSSLRGLAAKMGCAKAKEETLSVVGAVLGEDQTEDAAL